MTAPARALDEAYRREWARVLATTVRLVGDLDLAEECVQDAFVRAVEVWTADGVPPNPGGWLTTTARRRAIDVLRRDRTLRSKLPLLVERDEPPAADVFGDDLLRLVFTCAHPALADPREEEDRGGADPHRVPAERDLPQRLGAVLAVVHLVFTAGHTAADADTLVRADLVGRAGLPLPAGDAGRPAAPPRPVRRGGVGVPGGARADVERRRAAVPAAPPHGAGSGTWVAPRRGRLTPPSGRREDCAG